MQLNKTSTLQSGKYRIIRVLGQGGFGITYLAEHTMLDKKVAIKEFFPKDYCNREATTNHITVGTQTNVSLVEKLKKRFLKEARNISRLNNPGVVKIHDVFVENNSAYYVMDYIEGESLSDIVKKSAPMDERRAVSYITKVGNALEYIHSMNMTHFDVKPANIMIRKSDDKPVLIDFGLSKQYTEAGEATTTGITGASRGFSPIEMYNLESLAEFSPQSDVYSLGATLLYLITGKTPPDATALAEEEIEVPAGTNRNVTEAIRSAMQISRKKRCKNIHEFIKIIDNFNIITKVLENNYNDNTTINENYSDNTQIITPEIEAIKSNKIIDSKKVESKVVKESINNYSLPKIIINIKHGRNNLTLDEYIEIKWDVKNAESIYLYINNMGQKVQAQGSYIIEKKSERVQIKAIGENKITVESRIIHI